MYKKCVQPNSIARTSNLPREEFKIKDFTFDILFNDASSEKKNINKKPSSFIRINLHILWLFQFRSFFYNLK